MAVVRADLRVVAADHCHRAADDAGGDAVQQRLRGAGHVHMGVGDAVQHLDDGLGGVAHGRLRLQLRDIDQFRFAVLIVLAGHADDGLGVLGCIFRREVDEFAVRHSRDLRSRDELRVEALRQRSESRENALHIHHDHLAGSGEDHIFLLQEIAGHRNALTHRDLVGGAADAADVDALRAVRLGERGHLRILRVEDDHLGEGRIMAVHHDVDHILLHHAEVRGGIHRLRCPEEDVRELRAAHRAAPAVGKTASHRLLHQRLRQRGTSHMRHMQRRRDLAVDGSRLHLSVMPELLRMLGRAAQPPLDAERLAVLEQRQLRDLMRQIVDILAFRLDAPLLRDPDQLVRVLDRVRAFLLRLIKRVADGTAVIGMGRAAARREIQEVPADDAVHVAAADAPRRLRRDPAGSH